MVEYRRQKISELKKLFETLSPIVINPRLTSLTIGISRRFFLFDLIQKLTRRIEDDPYLNFVSALKYYKVLGKFLSGDIRDLYRDRHKIYFRDFFVDKMTYRAIRQDIEWAYAINPNIKLTITKRGLILYDNYKKNQFNILLITPHAGEVLPKKIEKKQVLTRSERIPNEDTDSHRIYGGIVLRRNGIWLDSKLSRFACDYNRPRERAIYENHSEAWLSVIWKTPLTTSEKAGLLEGHDEFYFTLKQVIDTHRFNIIFDGHTMVDAAGRPDISFGTQHIPKFYMPVVRSMREKMRRLGYESIGFNQPFGGGNILGWCKERFPDVFICSMEINKKIYMNESGSAAVKKAVKRLGQDLVQIFDIEDDLTSPSTSGSFVHSSEELPIPGQTPHIGHDEKVEASKPVLSSDRG